MIFRQVSLLCISFLLVFSIILPSQSVYAVQKGVVTTDILNVRSAPSTNASLLGQLRKGNEVNVMEVSGDWATIQYSGKEAFVHKNFVQLKTNTTQPQQPSNQGIKIFVNNKQMVLPAAPVNDQGRLLVPFRVLGEALGIQIDWLNATRQVLAKDPNEGVEVLFTINNEKTVVNGKEIVVKPAPRIVNQSTLLPLRFFSETFGADVVWNEKTREVTITRAAPEQVSPVTPIVQVKGIVQADVLNVRKSPSTNAEIIDRVSRGAALDVIEVNGEWAKINHKNQQAYVHVNFLSMQESTKPNTSTPGIKGKKIVVDAGHGGRDPGATKFGIHEKDVVLAVSLVLQKKLEEAGATVIMTRSNDTFIELADRVHIANNHKADSFISVHANAAGNAVAHGTETYWNRSLFTNESKDLADKIQKQLIDKLKTNNRGVKEANFYVIRHTQMPSVLVELGFITNEAEAKRMMTPQFHEDSAEAIFQGILEFYRVEDVEKNAQNHKEVMEEIQEEEIDNEL